MLTLAIDAATKGNPGPSGAGIIISGDGYNIQISQVLPDLTNHQAEFAAAKLGFQALLARNLTTNTICLITDSKLVFQSLEKRYAKHYETQVEDILALERRFQLVFHKWRPDHQNKGPHQLAQNALFKQLNTKK
ncbi:ribonuclease HI family protein [Loigolactobacillus iwatensis]|uniref:ribonuclease HI family protein n=1 Tax=Loigolactobacillus iwatensis TaxID=1267156 RepID=UPI000F7F6D2E|nr:ribonuclease HI family protein [Loigolactobacillus iwatensis]